MRSRSSPSHAFPRVAPITRRLFWQCALAVLFCACSFSFAYAQDAGSAETEFRGNGVAITVVVHDPSGEPISSAVMVKLFRGGTIPSGQAQTNRGRAEFVVNNLGEFTIHVEAPGFASLEKEISLTANGRAQVDVYLLHSTSHSPSSATPGRPLLSPKAGKALDEALRALSEGKLADAEKYAAEATRLAPGHPDVLYLRGLLFLKQRNWPQAQSALEKATQLDPSHAQAFAALGMAFCDQKKFDAAIPPLEKSLQLNPAAAWDVRWTLAKAYYQHQQYDRSLDMSQNALAASNGKAPEIALLVAQSLTAVGRYDDAAQILRAFLHEYAGRTEAVTARRWLDRLAASGKLSPADPPAAASGAGLKTCNP